jgi:UrcA family protein
MLKLANHVSSSLLGVVCAVASVAAGVPAFGQGADDFTVLGHNERPYGSTLSATVSYRDLDLTNRHGQAVLRQRVWRTAETLCARIGENHIGSATGVLSCEDQVAFSAARQQRDAIARAMVAATTANRAVASVGSAAEGASGPGSYILTLSVATAR